MDKAISYWRACLLGAVAGLFSSTICLFLLLIDEDSAKVGRTVEQRLIAKSFSECPGLARSPIWPMKVSIAHIAFYVVASLLVHSFLSERTRSVFMLWQYIGLVVIGAWALFTMLAALVRVISDAVPFHLISPFSPAGIKFTFVALAANVIYGTAIQVAARHYEGLT
jgi:hypothetical protein